MTEAYTDEYTAIRAACAATMRDTCQIGTRSTPTGDPGDVTWTYGATISCGLHVTTRGEVVDGSQATITTAVVRLPWGTSITPGNRIKMITQAGVTLSPSPVYACDGAPYFHVACVQVPVRYVTGDGSVL